MDILAITRHHALLEALRAAFGPSGHRVEVVDDPLQALAAEAWNRARLILVDAEGDPMDGYRLCHLLRGESRILFRNLPIFLILDHTPTDFDHEALLAAGGDGFVTVDANAHRLQTALGPLLDGGRLRNGGLPTPVAALGLRKPVAGRIAEVVRHFGMELHAAQRKDLARMLEEQRPPLLFLGVGEGGEQALQVLQSLQASPAPPYTILVGGKVPEAVLRRLLAAGAMAWLDLPLSGPMLLHACRQALEWIHVKRLKAEYQFLLGDLSERRALLEREASALRSEVLTDPLTELLNRRAFTQNLEHAGHQWQRSGRSFVLVLGDLDYFKLINDRFGHMVGDQVLKAVGQRIRASLRRSDLAFRIGGEEFAILLMETSLAAGVEVAEKIRQRIEATPVKVESGQTVLPTMSFGVGAPDARDAGDLFIKVDEALYVAKHKGRNRIETVEQPGGNS